MSTLEVMGKRIQQRRKEFRITQIDLAKALGLSEDSRSSISRWEKGTEFPSTTLIPKLCDILHCDVGYLFGEYELPTRELTDISRETGLSMEAIEELRDLNEIPYFKNFIPVLNWLLVNGLLDFDILATITQLKTDAETVKALDYYDESMPYKERAAQIAKYNNAQNDSDLMKFKADCAFRKLLDKYFYEIAGSDNVGKKITGWEVIENGID